MLRFGRVMFGGVWHGFADWFGGGSVRNGGVVSRRVRRGMDLRHGN